MEYEILQDDIMLPTQFGDMFRSRMRSGEQRLALALLEDALRTINRKGALPGARLEASRIGWQRGQAISWIMGDPAPMPFATVCEALHVECEWFREQLLRLMGNGGLQLARRVRAPVFGRRHS